MKRIQIIEDDRDIVELVRYNLANEGYDVQSSPDGISGLAQLRKSPPDLLMLDLMLPKMPGLEICKEIRRDPSLNRLPILMLTARGEEADRVIGLEMGADDYVTKPFSPRELVARVKALLRRTEPAAEVERAIEVGKLVIDPSSYRVMRSNKPLTLSTLEFRLVLFSGFAPQPRVLARSAAGRGVGHRAFRDAAERGCIRAAVARKDRGGPGASCVPEDGARGGLHVRIGWYRAPGIGIFTRPGRFPRISE